MKKVLGSILFVIYVTIVLTVTILLLSYNEYMCSEINGYTVYIVKDDMLEPDYKKGDLLIEFNLEAIKNDGYDVTTIMVVTNSDKYLEVVPTKEKVVRKDNSLLTII